MPLTLQQLLLKEATGCCTRCCNGCRVKGAQIQQMLQPAAVVDQQPQRLA
jgi:hypothetical protein